MIWPRRVTVALLTFIANVIAHCDRVSISAAVPSMMKEYGWDTAQTGLILSGFFVGYTALMIPVGFLVDRAGPRRVFAASIAWWSLFTALTPFPRTIQGLAAARMMLGVGESGVVACINATLIRWFPAKEFARAAGLCWSGGYFGPIIAFPLASLILHQFGWRAIFYVFGALGVLWLPFWLRLKEPPKPVAGAGPKSTFPWRDLLSARPIWAVFLLHFSSNWFLYFLISWLPSYLLAERQLSLAGMAFGASLPFVCAWGGTQLFAQAIDRLSLRRPPNSVFRLTLVPYAAAAIAIFLIPLASTAFAAIALLCAAATLFSAVCPVFSSGSLRLAPANAGSLASIQNAFANLSGVIAPAAVGFIVRAYGWPSAFWLTGAIVTAGCAAYLYLSAPSSPRQA